MNTNLSPDDPAVADHLVAGTPVLPGAAQVDMMLSACDARRPDRVWRLDQVTFLAPLAVTAPVAVAVAAEEDGACAVATAAGRHSQARATASPLPPPTYLDVAALRAGCAEQVPLAEVAAWRSASGIAYGPSYQAIRTVHRGGNRLVALLRETQDRPGRFVPPALLDSVFQCLGLLDGGASGGCLPWVVGSITARRAVSGSVYAVVELTDAKPGVVRGRATVCTLQGEVLLELDRITLKGAAPDAVAKPHAGTVTATTWWASVPTPERTDGLVVTVTPNLSEARVEELLAAGPREVVFLAPTGVEGPQAASEALLWVFSLVRKLGARPPMPGLTIVTRHGQCVVGTERVDPVHAALWGFARSLRVEHPRTRVRLVDVGDADAPGDLLHEQPELVWREGSWFTPRHTPVDSAPAPVRLRGGRFLITGGMGGLGLLMAEALADAGCAHLTLVGRRVPDEARERLNCLAARCEVVTLACDISALAAQPRFDGVIHAAGVLRDGLARTLDPEKIAEVFAPKIGGAHAIAAWEPPGFVALFSSISATHGNLGQSSYSTANAYLDGFAALQRARGGRWYSLGWGLWAVGMGEALVENAAKRGIHALTAEHGVALLHAVLGMAPGNYVLAATEAGQAAPMNHLTTATPPQQGPTDKDTAMTAVASENQLWDSLSAILKKTLQVPAVSPQDDLLDLGLDSMMAVEIGAALNAGGFDLDPSVFFDHTNVGALHAHLETLRPSGAGPAAVAAPMTPTAQAAYVAPAPVAQAVPVAQAAPVLPVAAPVVHAAPVAQAAPAFAPAWDQFRPDHATAPPTPPALGTAMPAPQAAAPVMPPAAAPPAAMAPPAPVAPAVPPPAAPAAAPARPVQARPGLPPGISGAPTPRRTLPARLTDAPAGSFLDQRIDALSVDDRAIVANGDYFYEPVIEESQGSQIKFDGRWFLNFASYSYLGLVGHEYINQAAERAIRKHGTGAHGVRLLAGTLHLHRELELTLARFLGTEDAIVFTSGYMANVATVGSLVGPGDFVIGDVYNHASILDGYRLSGATVITYAHNDMADLERALRKAGNAGKLVVTDAVFSMDGDVANLPAITELCERYGAPLMVDEAHSIGVLGATGRGITEHFGMAPDSVPIKMGTLSKTIPSTGGYVAGSADLIFALKNNARGWMFSAAGTPAQVAAAKAAVEVIEAAPHMVDELRRRTARYRDSLNALGFDTMASETPVVPIICPGPDLAMEMARLCQREGLFVQPIVYPTVPKALSRLRTIVNLSHTEAELDHAVRVIADAGRKLGLIA
ncbi:aminotransferase class I/II-fold pyridoxal phosphate-dependent enzyme [Actinokineospora guangxiensis]|uniref:8-amino-7-oxononanoate synthase n=1 Tax=Actinokineospora guangxiensis TaxID=1490288 RepID=A0ABW0EPE9_9PSEU